MRSKEATEDVTGEYRSERGTDRVVGRQASGEDTGEHQASHTSAQMVDKHARECRIHMVEVRIERPPHDPD